VPQTWTGGAVPASEYKKWIRSTKRTDPGFARFMRGLVAKGALDRTRFVARDPATGDTLRIAVGPPVHGGLMSAEDIRAEAKDPKSNWTAAGAVLLEATEMQVGGHPAVRTMRAAQANLPDAVAPILIAELDVLLNTQDPREAAVIVNLSVDDTADRRELVDRILSSVRPL
jgi:hypothetical protein